MGLASEKKGTFELDFIQRGKAALMRGKDRLTWGLQDVGPFDQQWVNWVYSLEKWDCSIIR